MDLPEKYRAIYDIVMAWKHGEPVYRPEWESWKLSLGRAYEHARRERPQLPRDASGVGRLGEIREIDWAEPPLVTLGKSKHIARIKKYTPIDDAERNLCAWLITFFEEWTLVGKRLADMKEFLVAGRKPSSEQVARAQFKAAPATIETNRIIAERVAECTADWKKEHAGRVAAQIHGFHSDYLLNRISKVSGEKTEIEEPLEYWQRKFKCTRDEYPAHGSDRAAYEAYQDSRSHASEVARFVEKCIEDPEYPRKQGLSAAQAIVDVFTGKMQSKLAFAVGRLKSLTAGRVKRAGRSLEAELEVVLTDGTSFLTRNKIVQAASIYGLWFYRYPTTFHNVKLAGREGCIAMASEEEMGALLSAQRDRQPAELRENAVKKAIARLR